MLSLHFESYKMSNKTHSFTTHTNFFFNIGFQIYSLPLPNHSITTCDVIREGLTYQRHADYVTFVLESVYCMPQFG